MEKHQSFGYLTKDEWEQLKSMGIGPAREALMKSIEKRIRKIKRDEKKK